MNQATFGDKDLMTVGETWGAIPEIAKMYSDPKRQELSMVFQFEHVGLDQQDGKEKWDLKPLAIKDLKVALSKWQNSLGNEGWNSLFGTTMTCHELSPVGAMTQNTISKARNYSRFCYT